MMISMLGKMYWNQKEKSRAWEFLLEGNETEKQK